MNTVQWLDYHIWATDKVLTAITQLPTSVFTEPVQAGFTSIADVVGHLAAVDDVWLQRILGQRPQVIASIPFATIEEASQFIAELHQRIRQTVEKTIDLQQPIVYYNTKGERYENSLIELIGHIVNHGTYHRGNITTLLRILGYSGVSTDYIFYLREQAL